MSVAIKIQFWGQLFTGAIAADVGACAASPGLVPFLCLDGYSCRGCSSLLPANAIWPCLQDISWVWVFLNGPLICPVCHFLYWQATAFPCTALHMVTSQDLTQSMSVYYSLSISCSNMTKQRLLLVVRAAQGMTCHRKPLWCKAVGVECPFLPSLCLPLLLTLQKGKSLCFHMYLRPISPAIEKPTKKWPGHWSISQDSALFQREVSPAFHLPHCCERCICCQVKALLPFCTCGGPPERLRFTALWACKGRTDLPTAS